jgi:hypothetical protein
MKILALALGVSIVTALAVAIPAVAYQGVGPGGEEKVLKISPVVHVGMSHGLYHALKRAVDKAAQTPKGQSMVVTLKREEAQDLIIQTAQSMANGRRWVAP